MPFAGCLFATTLSARPAHAADADASPAPPPASAPITPTVGTYNLRGVVLRSDPAGWGASLYGFAEIDSMYDTTRSFNEGEVNNTLARPHTYAGDNPRMQFTVRNSRFGFDVRAPDVGSLRTTANVEMDFFGTQAAADEGDLYTNAAIRVRHFYVKLQTPVVDFLAGQYHDLYGWGGAGFYPNTVAFLPLLGEIYHRDPQFRLSKAFGGQAATFEIAVAAVRPGQRDAALPDGQAGMMLKVNGFRGAAAPGASRPVSAPFAVGISALGRRFSVTDFSQTPGNDHVTYGGGVAGNIFLPIIPAHGPDKEDLGNALSMTLEGSMETGAADMYPGLTGGVLFPSLPNPQPLVPVPTYTPNVDPGLVTYDSSDTLHTINWSSAVANLHYHFPFGEGRRLWLSFTGAIIQSNNAVQLTPSTGQANVWNKGNYLDGNLWISPTGPLVLGLSFQTMAETFGDGVTARNYRGEGSCYFFF
jgi:hypothetical protein